MHVTLESVNFAPENRVLANSFSEASGMFVSYSTFILEIALTYLTISIASVNIPFKCLIEHISLQIKLKKCDIHPKKKTLQRLWLLQLLHYVWVFNVTNLLLASGPFRLPSSISSSWLVNSPQVDTSSLPFDSCL